MNTAVNSLDVGQYTLDEIRKYEAIYGHNFVSRGGEATTRALLTLVALRPNMFVLDVGCGLGGAAFVLATTFGVRVHGIDLSRNMLQLAQERYQQAQQTHADPLAVSFEHADMLHYDHPASYDLVHSRDVFLHIHDKARLLASMMRCLRPGGHLLFTDYLCRAGEQSAEFAAYIHSRGYDLHSLADYHQRLERLALSSPWPRIAPPNLLPFWNENWPGWGQLHCHPLSKPRWLKAGKAKFTVRVRVSSVGVFLSRKNQNNMFSQSGVPPGLC